MQAQGDLDAARRALAEGNWDAARTLFEAAVPGQHSAEALDGLGRAHWWLKDVTTAVHTRTQAYAAYVAEGRVSEAASLAVWLSRELRILLGNDAAADGWLARAQTLSRAAANTAAEGWVQLAKAERAADVEEAVCMCQAAVHAARATKDHDLEIVALARLGLLCVARGEVDAGIEHLDEAMAAASAGEAADLQTVGEAFCALMDAAELLGDRQRFAQWAAALETLRPSEGFGPLDNLGSSAAYGNLSAFCGACCGGMYLVTGRLDEAEDELRAAIAGLESAGMDSRCVHPVTQLAELRVLQGRFEEARVLLEPYEDLPEAVRPLAVLELASGSPAAAVARLRARIEQLSGLAVAALPLWTVLLDAQLARGDLAAAADAAAHVRQVAGLTQSKRHTAEALFARGKLAASRGDADAPVILREAARSLGEAGLALPACRARMELSRALISSDMPVAISEARGALAAFERLGALPDADAASAFLRALGVKGRTGPKDRTLLSRREIEVLRLLAQGLSNAEVASRLFISVKTAGHHVSSILSKLGLRSRTEAAAYAALNLDREPVRK